MLKRFARLQDGATMVEMAIAMTLLLLLTLGFVDLGNALYQWNSANKAVQVGARLAAISNPVANGLAAAAPTDTPGAPVVAGAYSFECGYLAGALSCNSGAGDTANFSRIFRGDTLATNNDACPLPTGSQRPGMCHFYPFLKRENVVVRYAATGLGYQTRQAGPVPTITVSLRDVKFRFFFLNGLLGFREIDMPPMLSTVTGEDMKSTAP
ncbi:TadE/TadG family type IV pilus assembly protein [Mesorhizobium sp. KR2-14]|uniref:TadE/TadG family type IV pilus assembly protein n=1 Tax=Mesorhizobium sp. KR2-14 TaxID=3156610 RepID=UPI0032B36E08